jgi:hypothetical protein
MAFRISGALLANRLINARRLGRSSFTECSLNNILGQAPFRARADRLRTGSSVGIPRQ